MPVKATSTVGERIARARDTYRLSQAQLGRNLGVTRAAVSQYEQDKIRPRAKVFDRLAELFNTSPQWFERGAGKPPNPLDAPLNLPEINVERLDIDHDPRELANGLHWQLPVATLPGLKPSAYDHIVVIRAPNDADPIRKGDRVVIDTQRRAGGGIALVVSDKTGARLLRGGRPSDAPIIGYAVAYLRSL